MPTESTIVQVDDVTKRFVLRKEKTLKERLLNFGRSNLHKDDFFALRNVSLEIDSGTTVGLIGPNGSGKSTLLKTVGGILKPTSGTVRRRGRMAALLELGAGFHPDLTGRENVYLNAAILGLSRQETDEYFEDIVEFSGIPEFIDTQVKFYSSGMYVRLAFAVAVHVNPDLLIVDEVLAVGDEPFQRKCLNRIRQFQEAGKTIVLVSHALEQVAELCNRVVVLEHGRIVFDGNPASGIRRLRDGFDSLYDSPAPGMSDSSDSPGKIVGLTVIDGVTGQPVESCPSQGNLAVNVWFETERPVADLNCHLEIETPLGHRVFTASTEDFELTLPAVSGLQGVRFMLPHISLGSGTYLVSCALTSTALGELTRDSNIAHFSVSTPKNFGGSTFIDAKAELLTESDPKF